MARILVLYGTTDGHTAKVVATVADALRRSGAAVDVIEAGTKEPEPEEYAGVIVAASVHARGYQRSVRHWVTPRGRVGRQAVGVSIGQSGGAAK